MALGNEKVLYNLSYKGLNNILLEVQDKYDIQKSIVAYPIFYYEFKLNPIAEIPRGEATPLKMFSFSNEFASQW